MKTILAMGAHFDDVETGVGGTLMKHVEKGDLIVIAILSSDEYRTGDPKVRNKEQRNAIKLMGIPKDNLILFKCDDEPAKIISNLDQLKADIIYTPYKNDTHQDHRRCSKIGESVGRKRNITTIFYYCGSSIGFSPNLFSLFDYNKKMELINCYKTQVECGALKLNSRQKMEAYWATLVSEDESVYAEGLIIRKMIYEV
jgi:LmbE family N-acetylglucosaminyl deacetylase